MTDVATPQDPETERLMEELRATAARLKVAVDEVASLYEARALLFERLVDSGVQRNTVAKEAGVTAMVVKFALDKRAQIKAVSGGM